MIDSGGKFNGAPEPLGIMGVRRSEEITVTCSDNHGSGAMGHIITSDTSVPGEGENEFVQVLDATLQEMVTAVPGLITEKIAEKMRVEALGQQEKLLADCSTSRPLAAVMIFFLKSCYMQILHGRNKPRLVG